MTLVRPAERPRLSFGFSAIERAEHPADDLAGGFAVIADDGVS